MSRRVILLASVLCMLGSAALMAGGDKVVKEQDDNEKILGNWDVVSVEIGGKAAPVPEDGLYVFTKDEVTNKEKGKPDRKGTYKLDSGKTPKELDLDGTLGNEKGIIQAIYELDGNSLKIAYPIKGTKGKRPAGFKAKEVVVLLMVRKKS
jgi:uncharacterized protein (TIGR03067 family)